MRATPLINMEWDLYHCTDQHVVCSQQKQSMPYEKFKWQFFSLLCKHLQDGMWNLFGSNLSGTHLILNRKPFLFTITNLGTHIKLNLCTAYAGGLKGFKSQKWTLVAAPNKTAWYFWICKAGNSVPFSCDSAATGLFELWALSWGKYFTRLPRPALYLGGQNRMMKEQR